MGSSVTPNPNSYMSWRARLLFSRSIAFVACVFGMCPFGANALRMEVDAEGEGVLGWEVEKAAEGEGRATRLRDGLKQARVDGDRIEVERQGEIRVVGEGGAVEVSGFRRRFTGTVWRTVEGMRLRKEVDYEPVRVGEESKLLLRLTDGSRTGRYRVDLTFYPNVRELTEAGSLINVDGVFFGFRQTGESSYALVALAGEEAGSGGELAWEAVYGASVWRPETDELASVVSEGEELMGMGGLNWGTVQLSFLLDYDARVMRAEDGSGTVLKEGVALLGEGEEPYLVVSSGFGSEIAVLDLVVQAAEEE